MPARQYTLEYVEKAFYIWYENDRPGMKRLSFLLNDKLGKSPTYQILDGWKSSNGWEERADALDAQLSVARDTEIIDKRIKMFQEHASAGQMIIDKGIAYFKAHEVEDAGVALKAITAGVEIQRISVGQAEAWAKVAKMSDDQILSEIRKLTGKEPENEFTTDTEEIIDTVSEDITPETE